jgi:hypothetical protein
MTHVLLLASSTQILVPSLKDTSGHFIISRLSLDLISILIFTTTEGRDFHKSVRDVHLDVGSTFEKSFVQVSGTLSFSLFNLKVDVCLRVSSSSSRAKELYLPDNLGHIQRLSDSKLKDSSDSLKVFNSAFDLCPLDPGGAERGVVLRSQLLMFERVYEAYGQELLI